MYFRYYVITSPCKRAGSSIWTKLNSHQPRMLCDKFGWNGQVVLEKNILFKILSMYICYLVIISNWKRARPFIWTNLNPLNPFTHYPCFVPSLVEIGPVVLEKKMKMWKVYRRTDRQTDRRTDDRWSEKLTWAFSSGELKITYICQKGVKINVG